MSFPSADEEHHYRARTERLSMPGVMTPTFRCLACRQNKATKGRKRLGKGFVCAPCHEAREARKKARLASQEPVHE